MRPLPRGVKRRSEDGLHAHVAERLVCRRMVRRDRGGKIIRAQVPQRKRGAFPDA